MFSHFQKYQFIWIIIIVVLCSCSNISKDELKTTIDAKVEIILSTSIAALTEPPPNPTFTAYPSQTPFPTATQYPTATPYPTQEPYVTTSPYPTASAYSVFSTTNSVLTATPLPSKTQNPESAITTQSTSDNSDTVLQLLLETRTKFLNFGGLIDESIAVENYSLNCSQLIENYNNLIELREIDVSQDQLVVQNAFSMYVESINLFQDRTKMMVDNCRQQISGESKDLISSYQWEVARESINDAIALIDPQIIKLGGR